MRGTIGGKPVRRDSAYRYSTHKIAVLTVANACDGGDDAEREDEGGRRNAKNNNKT